MAHDSHPLEHCLISRTFRAELEPVRVHFGDVLAGAISGSLVPDHLSEFSPGCAHSAHTRVQPSHATRAISPRRAAGPRNVPVIPAMSTEGLIPITPELSIPRRELFYRASRSGGPGGQHVNTSSTRIELLWDVDRSEALTSAQRERIHHVLGNRISRDGFLLLASEETRSQHRNREMVTERFVLLLQQALQPRKPRKKTRPTPASRRKRIEAKKRRSEVKRLRQPPTPD